MRHITRPRKQWSELPYTTVTPAELLPYMKSCNYDSNQDGVVNKADSATTAEKVANKLTVGSKTFDGSSATTITASDLGALTSVPIATWDNPGLVKSVQSPSAPYDAVIVGSDGTMTLKGMSHNGNVPSAEKLVTARNINGVAFDGTTDITIEDSTKIHKSEKGAANGVATLDGNGLVPSSQLPSYVDDVIEASNLEALNSLLAVDKVQGKIYVAVDTGKTYRWSGTTFIEIANSLDYATSNEAQAGDNGVKVMTPLRTAEAISARRPFGTTATALTSGGTGVAGSTGKVADAGHTHTLPAYPTTLPPSGTAGGELTGTYPSPSIKDGVITTAKLANEAVTDAKVKGVNILKLEQTTGDLLIFDCGNA